MPIEKRSKTEIAMAAASFPCCAVL
jgi:hypothetical protein